MAGTWTVFLPLLWQWKSREWRETDGTSMVPTRLWFVCIYNQRSWSDGVSDLANKKNLADDEVMRCCNNASHFHDRLMLFVCLLGACGISASLKTSLRSCHVPNAGSKLIKLIYSLISDLDHEISELAMKPRLCKGNNWFCMFTYIWCLRKSQSQDNPHAAHFVSALGAPNEAGHIAMFQLLAAGISMAVQSTAESCCRRMLSHLFNG